MRDLRERTEPALRILCLILAGLVLYELARPVIRWNPFRGVTVPELPELVVATNNPAGGAHGSNLIATAAMKGTNGASRSASTNLAQSVAGSITNSVSSPATAENKTKHGTNLVVLAESPAQETNAVVISSTNKPVTEISLATNAAINLATNSMAEGATTNVHVKIVAKPGGTNSTAMMTSTNGDGTNLLLSASANGTNAIPGSKPKKKSAGASSGPPPDMAGMPGMPGMDFGPPGGPGRPGKRGVDLPPAVQARISRIVDSEILGPVMRPLPMALLGIAGQFAFLRSDSGQTGLVKEGDSLADMKLLRIGINRVLIEQAGQKKELTIFSGYGSDTLLQKDSTNDNKNL